MGNRWVTGRPPIDRRWLPLNALRAFEAAGQRLSFTAAAQALGVTQSAVSRHVIGLEALLGVALFERRPTGTAQGLALTAAGAALLPVAAKSFDRMEQSLNAVMGDGGGRRILRLHLPPSFAQLQAVPMLRDLRREYPNIALDITSPGTVGAPLQEVDAAVVFARPPGSFLGGSFQGGSTQGGSTQGGITQGGITQGGNSQAGPEISDLLWMAEVTPMCHPDVARQARLAASPAAFLATAELLHVKLEREKRSLLWENFARQTGLTIDAGRGLAFDTACLAAQYALSGEGVALLDRKQFAAELADGRLAAPFDLAAEDGYGYFLTIHPEDLADPAVAAFRAWIIGRFASDQAAQHNQLRSV